MRHDAGVTSRLKEIYRANVEELNVPVANPGDEPLNLSQSFGSPNMPSKILPPSTTSLQTSSPLAVQTVLDIETRLFR
ncbi:hypothetical protein RSOLAG1IB_08307 [Rhizoctonia solani AG-1 IB]|uniref:Uncharacterized protein n=1 Tax=Thanatephorus cucumeris (strain AG1-IB / isolate 7/3/14) TaxID=1108050 RepID=A0A0B7FJK2_THACB|nr:hypothetical protein RSOLAG1IB_08307 [Rhizoctonia solani AG-1 IB]